MTMSASVSIYRFYSETSLKTGSCAEWDANDFIKTLLNDIDLLD
jgi:hypothetical protein